MTATARPYSNAEESLATLLKWEKLPEPEREYVFAAPRKFRWDFCWPDRMLAVEVEGGIFTAGRHVQGRGFESGCEKQALGVLLGWRVLRVTPGQIESQVAVEWIKQALSDESAYRGRLARLGQ